MKTFFTYERDGQRRPMVTRCILVKDDKITFGQAMCSDKDRPVKKVGRAKAFGRAVRACERKKSEIGTKNNISFFKYLNKVNDAVLNEAEKRWLAKQLNNEVNDGRTQNTQRTNSYISQRV